MLQVKKQKFEELPGAVCPLRHGAVRLTEMSGRTDVGAGVAVVAFRGADAHARRPRGPPQSC